MKQREKQKGNKEDSFEGERERQRKGKRLWKKSNRSEKLKGCETETKREENRSRKKEKSKRCEEKIKV